MRDTDSIITSALSYLFLVIMPLHPRPAAAQDTVAAFRLAEGLEIELVAEEPLIRWPVVADWDEQGRLVVVESGGVGWPIQEHNQQLLHRIVRLVDDDRDGKFDRRIVAADRLPFAEGVLCLGNDLLVGAPPNIWKLSDQDGDGVCEERQVWFDGQTVTNCANDLHGPYWGRAGWIYWCKGAFGEQTHELTNGTTLHDKAAHIYRRHPSGGPIESVISGGMDNPVEMAMTPEGEKFFTSTFLQHPGDGKRDGIGHAVYGSVFGKDHSVLSRLKRTGPLMPIMTHLGPAAPSGLICLRSTQWTERLFERDGPAELRVLLSAQFNLHRVAAHRLVRNGATFATEDLEILTTDRVDFHPTDVLEDADGSILVLDTGGWYDLCCPTSRVDQKVAPGGIYRITSRGGSNRKATVRPQTLEPSELPPQELVESLSDPRPWIRRSAQLQLGSNPSGLRQILVARSMNKELPMDERLDALWGLSQLGQHGAPNVWPSVEEILRVSHEEPLELAACQILSLHRYLPAAKTLLEILEAPSSTPLTQRLAAEALGRIGEGMRLDGEARDEKLIQSATGAIMRRLAGATQQEREDPVWRHAMVWALIELDGGQFVVKYLVDPVVDSQEPDVAQREAALVVLHQLKDDSLDALVVLETMKRHPQLCEVGAEILAAHPDWASQSKEVLHGWWRDAELDLLGSALTAWRDEQAVHALVGEWIGGPKCNMDNLPQLLVGWSGEQLPTHIVDEIADLVDRVNSNKDADDQERLLDLLIEYDWSNCESRAFLTAVKRQLDVEADYSIQRKCLLCLPAGKQGVSDKLFARLVGQGDFELLARLRLASSQAEQLLPLLSSSSSLELTNLLTATASADSGAIDRAVLEKLPSIATAKALPENFLTNLFRSRSQAFRQSVDRVSTELLRPPANVQAAVQQTLEDLEELQGDPVRGLQVFRGEKAACSACHQMGYIGGRIGPELTHIGRSRTREALLEAMLFPSARIEQSYQPWSVLTSDSRILNGLIERTQGETLVLRLSAQKTETLHTEDIEIRKPSDVSIMPTGLREILAPQEFADLLSLLESAK